MTNLISHFSSLYSLFLDLFYDTFTIVIAAFQCLRIANVVEERPVC